jgi:Fur family iron response transcriptional regulator
MRPECQHHKGRTGHNRFMRKRLRELSERAAARLRQAGLRPTRQRKELTALVFAQGDRHFTAEALHEEAERSGASVSLATVYNTLHQLIRARLLKEVVVDGQRSYFDTNVTEHQHFFVEDEGRLIDIPGDAIGISGVPPPPKGTALSRVDVIVRVRRA